MTLLMGCIDAIGIRSQWEFNESWWLLCWIHKNHRSFMDSPTLFAHAMHSKRYNCEKYSGETASSDLFSVSTVDCSGRIFLFYDDSSNRRLNQFPGRTIFFSLEKFVLTSATNFWISTPLGKQLLRSDIFGFWKPIWSLERWYWQTPIEY